MSYLCLFLLVCVDIILYGFGSASQNVNKSDLDKKLETGDKRAIRLNRMIENPVSFINTLQILVTTLTLIIGSIHIRLLADRIYLLFGHHGSSLIAVSIVFSTFVLLYVFLTFGILVPKKIAARYPEKWAYALVNPIYYLTKLFIPLNFFVSITSNLVVRLFGVDPNNKLEDVTEEEIISMVNEGHEQGVLEASEAEMITNIFEFGDKEAKDIMTHRENVVAFDGNDLLDDVMREMLDAKNSRFPVYEENIDNIIGIMHFKDVVRFHAFQKNRTKPIKDIEGLIMEASFIPETRNIDDLFKSMQSKKTHMVIVIDEYGQTSGIIAMEDILEEIVGNILDEYDEDEQHIDIQEDNTYVMDGLTTLDEVEEQLGISFEGEDYETLNGFLTDRLGRIPEENDYFETEYHGYRFEVLEVENHVIKSVRCVRIVEESTKE